jgi:undecaprenyl-diphosphatase
VGTETVAARWRLACLTAVIALVLQTAVVMHRGVLLSEAAVREGVLAWTSPWVVGLAHVASHGGTWRVLLPATVVLLAVSRVARRRWWLWLAVLAGAPIVGEAWQELVARRRPEGTALGFPSGHATSAACFAGVVSYLAERELRRPSLRQAVRAGAAGLMIGVGTARVVLGAHWPGDVLAGYALGGACAAGAAWWDAAHREAPEG